MGFGMEKLGAWWRSRTPRERILLRTLGVVLFFIALPVWGYSAAASFRAEAEADLAEAQHLRAQVRQIASFAPAQTANGDDSVGAVAVAAAESVGLVVERVSPQGPDRAIVAFGPADSRWIYRWMTSVGQQGMTLRSTRLTRLENSEQVRAEFEVARGP